jgi:EpsI family protein
VFSNADVEIRQSYSRNGETVDLFLAGYSHQTKGHDLMAYDNRVFDTARWTIAHKIRRRVDFGATTVSLAELAAIAGNQRRYIWRFYWVDSTFTANPIVAKLLEIKAKLFLGDQRAAVIAVATSEATNQADADRVLRSFLEAALPSIEALLTQTYSSNVTNPQAPR